MSMAHEEIHHEHLVDIVVNKRYSVDVPGPEATGLQIKEAAIAQGVPIEVDFQLSEIVGEHETKIVDNADEVKLHKGLRFTCVADDDNS